MASARETASTDDNHKPAAIAATASLSTGHDDAADARVSVQPVLLQLTGSTMLGQDVNRIDAPPQPSLSRCSASQDQIVDHRVHRSFSRAQADLLSTTQLPVSSDEPVPHSYQQALSNRCPASRFAAGADLDPVAATPIFIHDMLMLPGSLANLIGKSSIKEVLDKLTPARLDGLRTYIDPNTSLPILTPFVRPGESVHGLFYFGAGRRSRKRIERHYNPTSQSLELEVTYEVVTAGGDGRSELLLEQRTVMAEVYVWSNPLVTVRYQPEGSGGWALEDFLDGAYDAESIYYDDPNPQWDYKGRKRNHTRCDSEPTVEECEHAEVKICAEIEMRKEVERCAEVEMCADDGGDGADCEPAVTRYGMFISVDDICEGTAERGES